MSVPYFEGPTIDQIRENIDRMYGTGAQQFLGETRTPAGTGTILQAQPSAADAAMAAYYDA